MLINEIKANQADAFTLEEGIVQLTPKEGEMWTVTFAEDDSTIISSIFLHTDDGIEQVELKDEHGNGLYFNIPMSMIDIAVWKRIG